MRHILTIILSFATLFTLSAQRPWQELDRAHQQHILASRQLSAKLYEAYSNLEALDAEERAEVLRSVATASGNRKLQSLYLYLYESLRPEDGSVAHLDMEVLSRYPRYMLKRWSSDMHSHDAYNYAYSLGCYAAMEGDEAAVSRVLARYDKRRYRHRYAKSIAVLCEGVEHVRCSVAAGMAADVEHTPYEVYDLPPYEISHEEYAAAQSLISRLTPQTMCSDIEVAMAHEVTTWQGAYNSVVHGGDSHEVSITECRIDGHVYMVIRDDMSLCHTLPECLYILPSGEVFAHCRCGGYIDGVVVGRIEDGVVDIIGMIPLASVLLGDAKCSHEGLYLKVDEDGEVGYLFIPAEEL